MSMLPMVAPAVVAFARTVPGDEKDEAAETEREAQHAEEDAEDVNHGGYFPSLSSRAQSRARVCESHV